MKDLYKVYKKMFSSKLIETGTFPLIVGIIICSTIFLTNGQYNIGIFTICCMVFAFIFGMGIGFLNEDKYKMFLQLPIKMKSVIKISYLNVYLEYGILIVINFVMYIFRHLQFNLLNIFFISIFLMLFNISNPKIHGNEFKIQGYTVGGIVVGTILMCFLGAGFSILYFSKLKFASVAAIDNIIIMITVAILIAVFVTLKPSYKIMVDKL